MSPKYLSLLLCVERDTGKPGPGAEAVVPAIEEAVVEDCEFNA